MHCRRLVARLFPLRVEKNEKKGNKPKENRWPTNSLQERASLGFSLVRAALMCGPLDRRPPHHRGTAGAKKRAGCRRPRHHSTDAAQPGQPSTSPRDPGQPMLVPVEAGAGGRCHYRSIKSGSRAGSSHSRFCCYVLSLSLPPCHVTPPWRAAARGRRIRSPQCQIFMDPAQRAPDSGHHCRRLEDR